MKNSTKKWTRRRHAILTLIAECLGWPYVRWKYGVEIERFKGSGKRPYLILFNHQTAFDQFFVGMSFPGAVYFLASEDIFSKGWVSALIRFLVAPISIKKQTTDLSAVMACFQVAKEGGTIALAPEGNRTYSGKTAYINPAIVKMARKLKLPVALYRIEGGYGVQPRWSDVVRRGKMRAYVSRVIEPEEYAGYTNEELFDIIREGLSVDEGVGSGKFYSNKRAEYLERAMYVCPECGLSEFESNGNHITCKRCQMKIEYGVDKKLRAVDGTFPFAYVTEWYDYQNQYVAMLNTLADVTKPLYRETSNIFKVIPNTRKELLYKEAEISLYGDRIVINEGAADEMVFAFEKASVLTVLGRNKLNVYYEDSIYQFKSGKRFNALKYMNLFFRYKNIQSGDENATFLGI